MSSDFLEDYAEGMDALYNSAETIARFASALGIPKANAEIKTARVTWNRKSQKTTFEINPEFFSRLTAGERGAIIAHEAYHVLLSHFEEILDPYYEDQFALEINHECIINDGLYGAVGLKLPEDLGRGETPCFGMRIFNQDFSYFSTREGYDFIMSLPKEDDEKRNDDDQEDKEEITPDGLSDDSSQGENGVNQPGEKSSSNATDASDEEGLDDSGNMPKQHQCGGISVAEEDVEDMAEQVKEALKKALDETEGDVPDEILDAAADMDIDTSSYGSGAISSPINAPTITMEVNWRKLLTEINPKVKNYGKKKIEETWTKPERRYVSVYPDVIIPSRVHDAKNNKGKGDSIPTLIIGLDLSYSIPRELVSDLLALVHETPQELVRAIPVTWSDYVMEYDESVGKIVPAGGTNINAFYKWCISKAEELKVKNPDVLVITDGECNFSSQLVDKQYVLNKWRWCAIQPRDKTTIERKFQGFVDPRKILTLNDFKKK